MKRVMSGWWVWIAAVLCMATAISAAESGPPKVGGTFPDLEFMKPGSSAEIKYLGLSGSGNFKINHIKAQVVIIEIFSMYCPYCQAEAPHINRLYSLIDGNPALRDKIKILGIGVGNSQFETNTFKKKYAVLFPLIPDADFKLHKLLGEVRTPYFIVVKLNGGKATEIIYSRLGALESVETFLEQIIQSAGLK